jgi:hypothetical protein
MSRALPALSVLLALAGCSGGLPQPRFGPHGNDEVGQVVPTPPPPGQVEIIPQRPAGLKHPVWLDGEWEWSGRRWVWKEHGWQEEPPGEVYALPVTRRQPQSDGKLVHLPGTWRKDGPHGTQTMAPDEASAGVRSPTP